MTESNQGPAPPGTAARLRAALEQVAMRVGLTATEQHIAYHEHFITADSPCPQCVRIEAMDAVLSGETAAGAPTAPLDPVPEIERLKAENASLLESLRAAREEREKALKRAEQYERDWYAAKSEFGDAMAQHRATLRAAEQRAEAAEKRADMNGDLSSQWHDKWAAAEKRAADLMELLREALAEFQWGGSEKSREFADRARAALHDEERPQTMEVIREVVKEAFGENRAPVLGRAGEQGAEPGARTGPDRLVDAARDRSPDQVLGGSGRGLPDKTLDEGARLAERVRLLTEFAQEIADGCDCSNHADAARELLVGAAPSAPTGEAVSGEKNG